MSFSGSLWASVTPIRLSELVSTPNLVSALSFWVLLPNLSDCHAHDAYQSGKGKVKDDCVDVSRKRVFWFFFPIVLCAAWPLLTAIIVILFQKCMRGCCQSYDSLFLFYFVCWTIAACAIANLIFPNFDEKCIGNGFVICIFRICLMKGLYQIVSLKRNI